MKSEIQIQAEAFQTLHNTRPEIRGLLFHVPNGEQRNKITGMQLKASGVIAGVPDLILLWSGKAYGIEVKTPDGYLSPKQKVIHETWKNNGIEVIVCRSSEEIVTFVEKVIDKH